MGKPGVVGVHTTQRLNLSKPWEGPRMIGQCLEPDPGNLAVRDFRGAPRNVRHGETVIPPAIERAGAETPHLQRGALGLYPNQQVLKPRGSLEIVLTLEPLLFRQQGQHRRDRYWQGIVGPAGVLERGRGTGWVAWKPGRSHTRPHDVSRIIGIAG